ncbi:hypothetical protein R3P38DRAFT_2867812 [Favolaschia claudopus]|uniref:F-box domain-containing protein n=1 Tax=Favolaschia claudopus TaxID=2862362 RepID=A0AAW0D6C8_9AGAR
MSSRSRLGRTIRSFTTKWNSIFPPKADAYSPYGQPWNTDRSRRWYRPIRIHFIHRLPIEIVARIFVLGAEDDDMLPVHVSHVCRKWRAIALHTPSLWRRISLTPNEQMWRERIHRAKACSLDVQLVPWRSTSSGEVVAQRLDGHTVQTCMHVVSPFMRRIRSLLIVLNAYEPLLANAALSGCCLRKRGRALLLEELTLVYRANDDTKEFCLFSGYSPRLRRLTVDGLRLTWLPSLFQNLTYLDYTHHGFSVGDEAVAELLSMLRICTGLRQLRILFPRKYSARPSLGFSPNLQRVTLPYLSQLHLRVETRDIPPELARLVAFLSTPALACLYLLDLGRRTATFRSLRSFMLNYPRIPSLHTLYVEYGFDSSLLHHRRGKFGR